MALPSEHDKGATEEEAREAAEQKRLQILSMERHLREAKEEHWERAEKPEAGWI